MVLGSYPRVKVFQSHGMLRLDASQCNPSMPQVHFVSYDTTEDWGEGNITWCKGRQPVDEFLAVEPWAVGVQLTAVGGEVAAVSEATAVNG